MLWHYTILYFILVAGPIFSLQYQAIDNCSTFNSLQRDITHLHALPSIFVPTLLDYDALRIYFFSFKANTCPEWIVNNQQLL